METAIKTTIAQKNSEIEKLEQSKKSHLRMITSSAAKLRLKHGKTNGQENLRATEARKIRMYETHNPGFCYLRNGEYRKKSTNSKSSSHPDPIQCSEKIKAILFTNNELDIYKTMCLHLLGTHVQNKTHIQRKDGRLCSYVKTQAGDKNAPSTLQPVPQRVDTYAESPTKYDRMLPRYVLDVRMTHGISTTSVKPCEYDSGSDDEAKKRRQLLVPIFINSEIRMIINSVMEALEAVQSSKLKHLIELAMSPEELRDMLSREETHEYITELSRNPLVMKSTSYDFIMAHIMFDRSNLTAHEQPASVLLWMITNSQCSVPDKGTMDTVAQVLEVFNDSELRNSLHQIRRGILQRYLQLTNRGLLQRKKNCTAERTCGLDNSGTSNASVSCSIKYIVGPNLVKQYMQEYSKSDKKAIAKDEPNSALEKQGSADTKLRVLIKPDANKISVDKSATELDDISDDDSCQHRRGSTESTKCDLHSLTNSQRILLGLKVASLKSRPINMHQFEGKKKVDIAAIISPIIRPQVSDIDYKENSPENHPQNFALPERKAKSSVCKISTISTTDLENLTRAFLAKLRLEISETENKKRVNQFMAKI